VQPSRQFFVYPFIKEEKRLRKYGKKTEKKKMELVTPLIFTSAFLSNNNWATFS
jgi:hypothetical protein